MESPARALPRIVLCLTMLLSAKPKTPIPALNAVNTVPAGADMFTLAI